MRSPRKRISHKYRRFPETWPPKNSQEPDSQNEQEQSIPHQAQPGRVPAQWARTIRSLAPVRGPTRPSIPPPFHWLGETCPETCYFWTSPLWTCAPFIFADSSGNWPISSYFRSSAFRQMIHTKWYIEWNHEDEWTLNKQTQKRNWRSRCTLWTQCAPLSTSQLGIVGWSNIHPFPPSESDEQLFCLL